MELTTQSNKSVKTHRYFKIDAKIPNLRAIMPKARQ